MGGGEGGGVTGDRCRDETLASEVQGGGNFGVVPLLVVEPGLAKNFLRLNMLGGECVAEQGDVVRGALVLVLSVLVSRRRAWRGTRTVSPVARSSSSIPMFFLFELWPRRSLRAHAV